MIKELKKYSSEIIDFKKGQIYKSYEKGIGVNLKMVDSSKMIAQSKELTIDDNYFYIVVNTTKILDSHMDLHLDGVWNKTKKEQAGKVYLVDTHVLSIKTTFAKKEDIELIVTEIPFAAIGKNYTGNTQALIYKIRKDKITDTDVIKWLNDGYDIEASVRMQYVDIVFCLDSDNKEDVKEKANYDKYINEIANKDEFDTEITYFWAVKQARNVLESSLVLFGSNNATGLIENKYQSGKSTVMIKKEPSIDTQNKTKTLLFILNQ